MSNKTQLQTNNTALDGYITRINAAKDVAASLPNAGGSGGGGVGEVFNVTINDLAVSAGFSYLSEGGLFIRAMAAGTYSCFYGICCIGTESPTIEADHVIDFISGCSIIKLNSDGIVFATP